MPIGIKTHRDSPFLHEVKRMLRSSPNRISLVLSPASVPAATLSETIGGLASVSVVIIDVQYGNFGAGGTTSFSLQVPRHDRNIVEVAVASRNRGTGVVSRRPTGGGGQWDSNR